MNFQVRFEKIFSCFIQIFVTLVDFLKFTMILLSAFAIAVLWTAIIFHLVETQSALQFLVIPLPLINPFWVWRSIKKAFFKKSVLTEQVSEETVKKDRDHE